MSVVSWVTGNGDSPVGSASCSQRTLGKGRLKGREREGVVGGSCHHMGRIKPQLADFIRPWPPTLPIHLSHPPIHISCSSHTGDENFFLLYSLLNHYKFDFSFYKLQTSRKHNHLCWCEPSRNKLQAVSFWPDDWGVSVCPFTLFLFCKDVHSFLHSCTLTQLKSRPHAVWRAQDAVWSVKTENSHLFTDRLYSAVGDKVGTRSLVLIGWFCFTFTDFWCSDFKTCSCLAGDLHTSRFSCWLASMKWVDDWVAVHVEDQATDRQISPRRSRHVMTFDPKPEIFQIDVWNIHFVVTSTWQSCDSENDLRFCVARSSQKLGKTLTFMRANMLVATTS